MTPSFINKPKPMQPRQMANALSRNAATTNIAITTCAALVAPSTNSTDAVMVNAAPTA